jgi:cell division protein FtsL
MNQNFHRYYNISLYCLIALIFATAILNFNYKKYENQKTTELQSGITNVTDSLEEVSHQKINELQKELNSLQEMTRIHDTFETTLVILMIPFSILTIYFKRKPEPVSI